MKKNYNGFSLIELLIVVVIIGVLVGLAIPAYQRYVTKSQVARVVYESASIRTTIDNCINKSNYIIGPASAGLCDPNATPSTIIFGDSQGDRLDAPNMGVPQVTLNPDGSAEIISEFEYAATPAIKNEFIRWTRSSDGAWFCESTAENKYNSDSCQ